ncbi:MAG TPA: alpha/beta hydrolase, partial [Flavitalea sp.]|nr:alpha/beta hydrolase [Flavitalea sp.]
MHFFLKSIIAILLFHFSMVTTNAQQELPLYKGKIPDSRPSLNEETRTTSEGILRIHNVSEPTLTAYFPPKEISNGAAIVICPGGGYSILAAEHEGSKVAEKLTEMGITAFVLKYRLPDDRTMLHKETGPLQDAQEALKMVRKNAVKWKVDPARVGILGFSAGGHLASSTGTNPSAIAGKKISHDKKPDFMILVYPVISFTDSIGHLGSRERLLGTNPDPHKIILYSGELQVTTETPPTFLIHAKDDGGVSVKNSILYYEALKKKGI